MAGGGGTPYPSNERLHRRLPAPFKEGGTITIATAISLTEPIAGDNYTRFYWKASKAGTLKFEFVRPYKSPEATEDVYDTKAVPDVTTVADTEKVVTVPVEGESRLKITFTPDATGTITYADISHNWGI